VRQIAVVVDSWDFPYNGTVVSSRRFVEALADDYEVTILGTAPGVEPADLRMVQFKPLRFPVLSGIFDRMKVPLAIPEKARLRSVLSKIDLLHIQLPFFLGFSALGEAKRQGIPVICSFHVQPENMLFNLGIRSSLLAKILYKFFISAFYNRVDLVIAPSEFAKQALVNNGLTARVLVLSNGVPKRFLEIPQKPKMESFKVLSVGRFAKEKCQATILQAIAKSKFKLLIELTMIGTGPLETEIQELADSLGLDLFMDSVSDDELVRHYGEADLFLHAGEIELEGMSVIEAMAAAKAIVVSDSKDSATGTFVTDAHARFEQGNEQDLADKIDYWLTNPQQRYEAAMANRLQANHLSHENSVALLQSNYDSLCELRQPNAELLNE
jgi:1,2-diacylglycerol 3-alpha-glucosyltransferase